MKFRIELSAPSFPFQINHQHQILSLGSCFADRIGQKFLDNKFQISANPFGVIFNPISIFKLLNLSLNNSPKIDPKGFVQHQDTWYHYDLHSDWRDQNQVSLNQKINQQIQNTAKTLPQLDYLFLTFGTAWVYQLIDNQEVVANCHKQVSSTFKKRLLQTEEIIQSFKTVYSALLQKNTHLKIILTVSPVRHIKDTLPLNNVSKSVLLLTCHELTQEFPEQVFYFPSYEFLIDDLRDYRFFGADMIHPNAMAEEYIWEKLSESFFDQNTLGILKKWQKLRQALSHKAFQPESTAHQDFLKKTLNGLQELSQKIALQEEITMIKSRIT